MYRLAILEKKREEEREAGALMNEEALRRFCQHSFDTNEGLLRAFRSTNIDLNPPKRKGGQNQSRHLNQAIADQFGGSIDSASAKEEGPTPSTKVCMPTTTVYVCSLVKSFFRSVRTSAL